MGATFSRFNTVSYCPYCSSVKNSKLNRTRPFRSLICVGPSQSSELNHLTLTDTFQPVLFGNFMFCWKFSLGWDTEAVNFQHTFTDPRATGFFFLLNWDSLLIWWLKAEKTGSCLPICITKKCRCIYFAEWQKFFFTDKFLQILWKTIVFIAPNMKTGYWFSIKETWSDIQRGIWHNPNYNFFGWRSNILSMQKMSYVKWLGNHDNTVCLELTQAQSSHNQGFSYVIVHYLLLSQRCTLQE